MEISRNEQVQTVKRPFGLTKFFFPAAFSSRVVVQSYTGVELPNLIPALAYRQLYSNAGGSRWSGRRFAIAWTCQKTLPTVISEVLRSHPTETSANQLFKKYPELLPTTSPRAEKVRQRTQEILATSPNPSHQAYEQTLYLAQYEQYKHSLSSLALPFWIKKT